MKRAKWKLFLTALPLLFAASHVLVAGGNALTIETEHERVTAAELARVMPEWRQAPPESKILYAPLPGLSRELQRAEIQRLAARHGIDPPSGKWPERILIVRRLRPLSDREVEAAIAASLAERCRITPEQIRVQLVGFHSPQVPAGQLRLRAGKASNTGEVEIVPLTWITEEKRSGTLWIRARVSAVASYVVAAHKIDPETLIGETDITVRNSPVQVPLEKWVRDPSEVVGKRLARRLGAGEKIPRAWLIRPKVVERGDVVELRLARGLIQLRVPGEAQQDGAAGERILFRNLQSGRPVAARVEDSQSAEVIPGFDQAKKIPSANAPQRNGNGKGESQ